MSPATENINTDVKLNNLNVKKLFSDITNGKISEVKQQINMGINCDVMNDQGIHFLIFAVKSFDKELVSLILSKNTIDINNIVDENGNSLLFLAQDNPELEELLESYGAEYNIQDKVDNPELAVAYNSGAAALSTMILWQALEEQEFIQKIDLFTILKEAIQGVMAMSIFSQDNHKFTSEDEGIEEDLEDDYESESEDEGIEEDLEDEGYEAVEETNNFQEFGTSLEASKNKELFRKLILDILIDQKGDLNQWRPKEVNNFLMGTLQELEKFKIINEKIIAEEKSKIQTKIIEQEELGFAHNPGLKTSRGF